MITTNGDYAATAVNDEEMIDLDILRTSIHDQQLEISAADLMEDDDMNHDGIGMMMHGSNGYDHHYNNNNMNNNNQRYPSSGGTIPDL
jgi:hypothetical protein